MTRHFTIKRPHALFPDFLPIPEDALPSVARFRVPPEAMRGAGAGRAEELLPVLAAALHQLGGSGAQPLSGVTEALNSALQDGGLPEVAATVAETAEGLSVTLSSPGSSTGSEGAGAASQLLSLNWAGDGLTLEVGDGGEGFAAPVQVEMPTGVGPGAGAVDAAVTAASGAADFAAQPAAAGVAAVAAKAAPGFVQIDAPDAGVAQGDVAEAPGDLVSQAQIVSLANGIDNALSTLHGRIVAEILAETMPLVGIGLQTSAQAGETALAATLALGTALSDALGTLSSAANQTVATIEATLDAALATAGFSGNAVGVTVSGGTVHITVASQRAGSFVQALASDLGLGNLGAATGGSTNVGTLFNFDLDFATDAGGFFIDTSAATDVSLDLTLGGVTLDPSLTLAGQGYGAVDAGTSFTGTVGLDLQGTGGTLTLGQLGSATLSATLDGSAAVAVGLTTQNQGNMTPMMQATLAVDWLFTAAGIDASDDNSGFGSLPDVNFETVTLDLGEFMESFVGPMVTQINDLLDPVRPIIDVLTASIGLLENFPGLGNLLDVTGDGHVTLMDVMQLALPSIDFTSFEKLVQLASDVADWSAFLETAGFAQGDLVLGEFDIGTGDIRLPGFDLELSVGQFAGMADTLNTVLGTLSGSGWDTTDTGSGLTGAEILDAIIGDSVFDLPILTDPGQWMNLFLGQTADLVNIDMPEVVIGPDHGIDLPGIPLFLGLNLVISLFAQARINMDFGFDTRGLQTAGLNAIDGFYIVDDPTQAEITLTSGVGLGIEANLVVASIYGGGDIQGVIDLDLDDTLGSTAGRLYFDEFIAALGTNPFSIFDASGSITAGFTAVIDTLFGELWRWSSPRVTIGNFGFDGADGSVDPNLAAAASGTLTLHTGTRASQRNMAVPNFDLAEQITVGPSTQTGKIMVTIFNYSEEFSGITAITGNGASDDDQFSIAEDMLITVHFSGGDGNDVISGAAANDTLNGGVGDDALFGNGGNDKLNGNDGDDLLVGAAGADTLNGGAGNDRVSYISNQTGVTINFNTGTHSGGDAAGDVLTSIEDVEGTLLDDVLIGSQGDGSFFGLVGDDTLVGGSHVQILFGNEGNDQLESAQTGDTLVGGEGDDTYIVRATGIWLGENWLEEIVAGSDSGYDWVKGHVSIDLRFMDSFIERISLYGAATDAHANELDNLINGNANNNYLWGYAGNDTFTGGDGHDVIWGGDDNDVAFGGIGRDTINGGNGNDTLTGNDGADSVAGDDGDDFLTGGYGVDTLVGGAGADRMWGGALTDYYNVDSLDTVYEFTGAGVDYVWANDSHALLAGQEVEILSYFSWDGVSSSFGLPDVMVLTTLAAIANDDFETLDLFIRAGLAATRIDPGAVLTADLTGNNFNQVLIGELGDPDISHQNILEGMAGADTLVGDNRTDYAAYTASDAAVNIDLSFAVQSGGHAQNDYFYGIRHVIGSDHNDTISGEIGGVGSNSEYANDLSGGLGDDLITGFGGYDTLTGGAGNDTLLGGSEDDKLFGNGGDDSLEGNEGHDTLDGGVGIDTLKGGLGDDRYIVRAGDVVVEFNNQGDDTVVTHDDFYLGIGDEIEHLQVRNGVTDNLILFGNTYAQEITGNEGDNTIHGGAGADTIDGGAGTDSAWYTLSGGAVQVDLNLAVQTGGHAAGDVLLGIENLRGSVFGDILIGHDGYLAGRNDDNEHFGEAGDDYIEDRFGQNTLHGGNGDDTLVGSGHASLFGGYGSELQGGNGNDSLDGGTSTSIGGDTMGGGMGDDTYRITSDGDIVDENWFGDIAAGADGGHDLLIIDVTTWDMGTGAQGDIEDGELGTGLEVTGNALDNTLTGNNLDNVLKGQEGDDNLLGRQGDDTLRGGTGNDTINGGWGDDEMYGWTGDDRFIVNSTLDLVVETAGNGDDTVRASVSYMLTDHVEHLVLTGTGTINGVGNDLDNTITGNDSDNAIDGGVGSDTLTGGLGADIFRFRDALGDVDQITDFEVGVDEIRLDDAIFAALSPGALAVNEFATNATGTALLSTQHILYSTTSGNLYYDADGSGAGARVLFATLDAGLSLSAFDFSVI